MTALVASPLPAAVPADIGLDDAGLARLRQALAGEIERRHIPGAVVLVARRGRIGFFEALGRQAPEAAAAMPRDAIFRIYSMTKPIVSVAALMLLEEGRLLVDAPVAQYLPAFAGQEVAVAGPGGEVRREAVRRAATVQDLLRHTAGLTYEFLGNSLAQQAYTQARIFSRTRSNPEFAQALAALPLAYQPGTVWEYSRATDVVGALVETVTGEPLGGWLQRHIFAPLGMVDTGFSVPAAEQHRLAEPFAQDPDTEAAVQLLDACTPPRFESGGGGLMSTAADYARFAQMLLAGGALDGTRLLGPRTVAWMTADHLGGLPSVCDLLPPGHGFGLGVAVRTQAGVAPMPGSVGSYFWEGLAGTSFFVDPALDLFAVLMFQGPGQRSYFRSLFRNLVYAAVAD